MRNLKIIFLLIQQWDHWSHIKKYGKENVGLGIYCKEYFSNISSAQLIYLSEWFDHKRILEHFFFKKHENTFTNAHDAPFNAPANQRLPTIYGNNRKQQTNIWHATFFSSTIIHFKKYSRNKLPD